MHSSLRKHILTDISVTDGEMEEFLGLFTETKLKKNRFLITPDQLVRNEYYVVKGCLKAYYLDTSGAQHIIQFAIEDWWISDFEAFFGQKRAKLHVKAIEDSVLLGINLDTLEHVYRRMPKFERFFRIKTTAAFVSLRKRILSSLEKTASERYIDFCQEYPQIERRVKNYHIANYLGIQPESLSRIRKRLEAIS